MTTATRPRKALRRKEAAAMYGVSVWTIDELIASGRIRAKRQGRAVLIDAGSMADWYEGLEDA